MYEQICMTLHWVKILHHCAKFQPCIYLLQFELRLLKQQQQQQQGEDDEELQKLTFDYISVDIYSNFAILLADMHIDSGYLVVVVRKEGSDRN